MYGVSGSAMSDINIPLILDCYSRARRRLILFDYDGTLDSVAARQAGSVSTEIQPLELLTLMVRENRNDVVLLTGRPRAHFDSVRAKLPFTLVVEHGGFYHDPVLGWRMLSPVDAAWLEKVMPAMNALCFEYEGTFLERKELSVCWHYENAVAAPSAEERKHIISAFEELPHREGFSISLGHQRMELRARGIDKGLFITRWAVNKNYDFVLAVGGEPEDDLFSNLRSSAFTIHVGNGIKTSARYRLPSRDDVLPFIRLLVSEDEMPSMD